MGQKSNPIGLRLGIIKGWDSNWFGGKDKFIGFHKQPIDIKETIFSDIYEGPPEQTYKVFKTL